MATDRGGRLDEAVDLAHQVLPRYFDGRFSKRPDRAVTVLLFWTHDAFREECGTRLAAQRKRTEATVYALAGDPASPGAAIAVMTLGHWDDPKSVETLLAIARDPARPRDVRDEALESLALLEAPEAIDTLGEAMADPRVHEITRCKCADALGAIGNPAALPALEALAKTEPAAQLRTSVRKAIESIERPG
jgi:HEAT repeat protein